MDNNFMNFRLKLIFLALCILILLAIRGHIKLGYAPELEKKNIAVAFDYYGAFEKDVEDLISRLEEAYMELDGIKSIHSVSEPGKGYILCIFSDKTSLDKAYVQLSDITANVWAEFPEGVNRPSITRSSRDTYPVYISYFSLDKETDADFIKEAYEAVPGVGNVELGGRKKKELMVELHSGRLAGMALPGDTLGSRLRSSNLARKVAMPGGQTLVLSSRLSSAADFSRVQVTPGLRLSDVADIKYQETESQSLGYIDGQPMLLFFIMKSGEGNTVRLCRELEKVTSQFGGSQLYSLGNKIEKLFIVSSSILLLLFVFLLLNLWFKTNNFYLLSQNTCRSMLSLLAAIAAVTAAGFQVDMSVMAALFLIVVFSTSENNSKLFQIALEEAQRANLQKVILNSTPLDIVDNPLAKFTGEKQREEAKKIYSQYITDKTVKTVDGRQVTFNNTGYKELKSHSANPTTLQLIPELRKIIRSAVPIFSEENNNKSKPNIKAYHSYARKIQLADGEYVARVVLREDNNGTIFYDGEATELKKVQELQNQPYRTPIAGEDLFTPSSNKLLRFFAPVNPNINPLPIAIILSTLIITLYAPVHFRNLILPFCIALSSGLCISAVCRYFIKESLTLRICIPLWCYTPLLFFALFLISNSSFSPFASDVSFSMEYEGDTSFPFIRQSALEVEAALLRWNAFDRLTLNIDQGRASFTVLGGKKRDIMAKISELSSFYPEIFFYIPEKHIRHAVDVTVYGNDVPEIENNILHLAKYVNKSENNVNIIYNFKSDVTNIVLEIPVKCASAGFYPYDVYKTLYYTASEPVVDKYFADDVETDVKIRGDARYRETLSGLLAVPLRSPFGIPGEAGDYITVRRESAQGRIYHKNRMRVMSFSVTGISRSKLRKIVSDFPFTGSCHGEVGQ